MAFKNDNDKEKSTLTTKRHEYVTSATNDEDKLNYVDVNFSAAGEQLTSLTLTPALTLSADADVGAGSAVAGFGKDNAYGKKDKPLWGATELAAFTNNSPKTELTKKRQRTS